LVHFHYFRREGRRGLGGLGKERIGKIHLFGRREKGWEMKAKRPWAFQISLPNREKKERRKNQYLSLVVARV
jgi:hypothetical protein